MRAERPTAGKVSRYREDGSNILPRSATPLSARCFRSEDFEYNRNTGDCLGISKLTSPGGTGRRQS